MSSYIYDQVDIDALRRKVTAMENALADTPDDKGLAITLASAKRRLRRAELNKAT